MPNTISVLRLILRHYIVGGIYRVNRAKVGLKKKVRESSINVIANNVIYNGVQIKNKRLIFMQKRQIILGLKLGNMKWLVFQNFWNID